MRYLMILLLASCAVMESARLGYLGGSVDAADGSRPINAATVSIEPFAALQRAPAERRDLMPEVERLEVLVEEYAEMLNESEAAWSAHVCSPAPEHIAPPVPVRWWQDRELLAWISGLLVLLVGGGEAVRRKVAKDRAEAE